MIALLNTSQPYGKLVRRLVTSDGAEWRLARYFRLPIRFAVV